MNQNGKCQWVKMTNYSKYSTRLELEYTSKSLCFCAEVLLFQDSTSSYGYSIDSTLPGVSVGFMLGSEIDAIAAAERLVIDATGDIMAVIDMRTAVAAKRASELLDARLQQLNSNINYVHIAQLELMSGLHQYKINNYKYGQ